MSWLQSKLRSLADTTSATPFECPRGWGPVSFHLELSGLVPFFGMERKCPIGGVTRCDSCRHPLNPSNVEQLRKDLADLEHLYGERKLSEREYNERRQLITGLQHHGERRRREAFRITAWILGPLGALFAGVGFWMTQHDAIRLSMALLLAVPGCVMLTLALSFAWLARSLKAGPDRTTK